MKEATSSSDSSIFFLLALLMVRAKKFVEKDRQANFKIWLQHWTVIYEITGTGLKEPRRARWGGDRRTGTGEWGRWRISREEQSHLGGSRWNQWLGAKIEWRRKCATITTTRNDLNQHASSCVSRPFFILLEGKGFVGEQEEEYLWLKVRNVPQRGRIGVLCVLRSAQAYLSYLWHQVKIYGDVLVSCSKSRHVEVVHANCSPAWVNSLPLTVLKWKWLVRMVWYRRRICHKIRRNIDDWRWFDVQYRRAIS
jgi:hypothetical protein